MNRSLVFQKNRIAVISKCHWDAIAQLFASVAAQGGGVMPHEIGNWAGIAYATAHAIVLGLAGEDLADNQWLVYHYCSEAPVAVRRFEDGFQPVPWACPECGDEVTIDNDLTYDLRCVPRGVIEFR